MKNIIIKQQQENGHKNLKNDYKIRFNNKKYNLFSKAK